MARVGRFARGGTGGSNLSQLIYDLMRSQMTRQANAIVDAYMNQYDYRGMGVPSRDYVLSFLREYLGNSWITQADRDQINQNIQRINEEENRRIETGFLNAINEDPNDISSVKDYIDFLREQITDAESPNLASEAKSKLFNALGTLVDRVGNNYKSGLIDADTFNAQTQEALDEYERGSSQHRQILTKVVTSRYDAEFSQQNMLLSNATAKGSDAYLAQLRLFKKWAAGQVAVMAAEGLAQVNENGDVISGIDAALDAQTRLNDASQKIKDAGAIAAKEAATRRLNSMNADANSFLKQVNQVLGSNYGTLQAFAANQIDVNRFYSSAPASVRGTDGFMNRDKFVSFMFGSGNSLMQAAKAAGVAQYKELNKLSKSYGRNTLVDDAAILFAEWSDKTAATNGEAIENTKILDQTIAEYRNLLAQYGNAINPAELAVHNNTISYLEQAREGKIPQVDGMTAWDLANPYSQEYNPATGQYSSTFEGVLNLAGGDAATAKEIENGKILSAYIGPDGKWKYGAAVAPDSTEALSYLDISSGKKKFIGVTGTRIVGLDPADDTKTIDKGTVYNLGNGDFMIRGVDGTLYKRNYDPFSGQEITYNDFKAKYTQRRAVSDTTGASQVVQSPEYVVGGLNIDKADPNVTDPKDALTSGLDKRIEDLRGLGGKGIYGVSPDAIDRIISREVETAVGAFGNSPYSKLITDKYGSSILAAPSTRGVSLALPPSMRDNYRADALTSYAFRNTPISQVFTPEQRQLAQNQFRAGERAPLGITPISKGVTPVKGIGAGKTPTAPIKL
jgi:hypothetical protein